MAGLRVACAQTHHSAAEYDIMLATCYSLTFQSALLPTDSADFATFVRGCAMITEQIEKGETQTVFGNISRGWIAPTRQSAPSAQLDLDTYPEDSHFKVSLSKGIVSLCAIQAHIGPRYRGLSFLISLQSVFSGLQVSPRTGYNRFLNYYTVWFKVAADRETFSGHSPDSESQLLWMFFICLQIFTTLLIDDVCSRNTHRQRPPDIGRPTAARKIRRLMEWLYAIEAMAPISLHKHFAWPRLVFDEAISRFDVPMVSESGLQAKTTALCNYASRSHYIFGDILELSASLANWTEELLTHSSHERGPSAKEYWDTISAQTIIGVLEHDQRINRTESLHLM
ncbi:hypothetical protein H2200_006058 [Cladophialophora chaetospira]|uniref:Uncharacterized protein n=1 Tax=Cladophialophora chaetospira TaxID=386627 RepID=A0AA38XAU6_9EURO|nr:hypothetical protein H2200_006058 [Cladophialophora chaetospira]